MPNTTIPEDPAQALADWTASLKPVTQATPAARPAPTIAEDPAQSLVDWTASLQPNTANETDALVRQTAEPSAWQKTTHAFSGGLDRAKSDRDLFLLALSGTDEETDAMLAKAEKADQDRSDPRYKGDNWFSRSALGVLDLLSPMVSAVPSGLKGAAVGTGVGAATGAGVGSLAGGVGAAPGAVAGAATGAATGFGVGMTADFYQQAGGLLYRSLRKAGVPHDTAIWWAVGAAVPYSAIEKSQIEKMPGLKQLIEKTGEAGYKAVLKKYIVNALKTTGEEVLQDAGVEKLTVAGGQATHDRDDAAVETLKEIPGTAVETFKQTIGPALILGGAGAGMSLPGEMRRQKEAALVKEFQALQAQTEKPTATPAAPNQESRIKNQESPAKPDLMSEVQRQAEEQAERGAALRAMAAKADLTSDEAFAILEGWSQGVLELDDIANPAVKKKATDQGRANSREKAETGDLFGRAEPISPEDAALRKRQADDQAQLIAGLERAGVPLHRANRLPKDQQYELVHEPGRLAEFEAALAAKQARGKTSGAGAPRSQEAVAGNYSAGDQAEMNHARKVAKEAGYSDEEIRQYGQANPQKVRDFVLAPERVEQWREEQRVENNRRQIESEDRRRAALPTRYAESIGRERVEGGRVTLEDAEALHQRDQANERKAQLAIERKLQRELARTENDAWTPESDAFRALPQAEQEARLDVLAEEGARETDAEELGDLLRKGTLKLPTLQRLREMGGALVGEWEGLMESLSPAQKRAWLSHTAEGSLDGIRGSLAGDGFDFATEADLVNAVAEVAAGKKVYGHGWEGRDQDGDANETAPRGDWRAESPAADRGARLERRRAAGAKTPSSNTQAPSSDEFYHGGSFAGGIVSRVLYLARSFEMGESYVVKAQERGEVARVHRLRHVGQSGATESQVREAAQAAGIEIEGTPASWFDADLHGQEAVDALVGRLKTKGYTYADLADVAYGATRRQENVRVVFPGTRIEASNEAEFDADYSPFSEREGDERPAAIREPDRAALERLLQKDMGPKFPVRLFATLAEAQKAHPKANLNSESEGVNHRTADGKESAIVIWENLSKKLGKDTTWTQEARRVARHEAKGHLNLRKVLGEAYQSWMKGAVSRKLREDLEGLRELAELYTPDFEQQEGQTKAQRDAHAAKLLEWLEKASTAEFTAWAKALSDRDTSILGEEIMANLAERPEADIGLWERIVAAVRQGLRKLGWIADVTENDVRAWLVRQGRTNAEARPDIRYSRREDEADIRHSTRRGGAPAWWPQGWEVQPDAGRFAVRRPDGSTFGTYGRASTARLAVQQAIHWGEIEPALNAQGQPEVPPTASAARAAIIYYNTPQGWILRGPGFHSRPINANSELSAARMARAEATFYNNSHSLGATSFPVTVRHSPVLEVAAFGQTTGTRPATQQLPPPPATITLPPAPPATQITGAQVTVNRQYIEGPLGLSVTIYENARRDLFLTQLRAHLDWPHRPTSGYTAVQDSTNSGRWNVTNPAMVRAVFSGPPGDERGFYAEPPAQRFAAFLNGQAWTGAAPSNARASAATPSNARASAATPTPTRVQALPLPVDDAHARSLDTEVGKSFLAMAEAAEAFQLGRQKTTSLDMQTVLDAYSTPRLTLRPHTRSPTATRWVISLVRQNSTGTMEVDIQTDSEGKWVHVYATQAGRTGDDDAGSKVLYQALNTYAHNNGIRIKGSGLSAINQVRRSVNMLSSLLRHARWEHLVPFSTQEIDGWKTERHHHTLASNIGATVRAIAKLAAQREPATTHLRLDWERDVLVNDADHGRDINAADLSAFVQLYQTFRHHPDGTPSKNVGIGAASLRILAAYRGLLSAIAAGRTPDAAQLRQSAASGTMVRAFYSRRSAGGRDVRRPATPGTSDDQGTGAGQGGQRGVLEDSVRGILDGIDLDEPLAQGVDPFEAQGVDLVKEMPREEGETRQSRREQPGITHTFPDGMALTAPGLHTLHSIRAKHVTPHEVDEFSTDYIGSGEGAQVYGWGLYFLTGEKTEQYYKHKFYGRREISFEALQGYFTPGAIVKGYSGHDKVLAFTGTNLGNWRVEVVGVTQDRETGQWKENRRFDRPRIHQTLPDRKDLASRMGDQYPQTANVYTVNLLPDHEDLLQWDKTLAEQSPKVKTAVAALVEWLKKSEGFGGYALEQIEKETYRGGQFYKVLEGEVGLREGDLDFAAEDASRKLAKLGVPGIAYLDGGSRHDGGDGYNYVIFDDRLVRILEKNGTPVEGVGDTRQSRRAGPELGTKEWLQSWVWGREGKPGDIYDTPRPAVIEELLEYRMLKPQRLWRAVPLDQPRGDLESWSADKEMVMAVALDSGRDVISLIIPPENTLVDNRRIPKDWVEWSFGEVIVYGTDALNKNRGKEKILYQIPHRWVKEPPGYSKDFTRQSRRQPVMDFGGEERIGVEIPAHLRGLTPKYQSHLVEFAAPLDKWLYYATPSQEKTAKHDGLLAGLARETGLSESALRAAGRTLRERVGFAVRGLPEGESVWIAALLPGMVERDTGVRYSRRAQKDPREQLPRPDAAWRTGRARVESSQSQRQDDVESSTKGQSYSARYSRRAQAQKKREEYLDRYHAHLESAEAEIRAKADKLFDDYQVEEISFEEYDEERQQVNLPNANLMRIKAEKGWGEWILSLDGDENWSPSEYQDVEDGVKEAKSEWVKTELEKAEADTEYLESEQFVALPENWVWEGEQIAGTGSRYITLKEVTERDEDGDEADSNSYRVSIRDHKPSVFRLKEFGNLDAYWYARNIVEFVEALKRLETWAWETSGQNETAAESGAEGATSEAQDPRTPQASFRMVSGSDKSNTDLDVNTQTRYSRRQRITPEQDRAYLAAVERGDTAEAQRLVDEAAKAAGYQHKAHHGSPSKPFWVFDPLKLGNRTGANSALLGFFAVKHRDVAKQYRLTDSERSRAGDVGPLGPSLTSAEERLSRTEATETWAEYDQDQQGWVGKLRAWDRWGSESTYNSDSVWDNEREAHDEADEEKARDVAKAQAHLDEMMKRYEEAAAAMEKRGTVHDLFLKLNDPFVKNFHGDEYKEGTFSKLINEAKEEGADGVIMRNVNDAPDGNHISDVFVFFKSSQAKLADAVTRDDQGNVIPLSQRFDEATPDIRYSRRDPFRRKRELSVVPEVRPNDIMRADMPARVPEVDRRTVAEKMIFPFNGNKAAVNEQVSGLMAAAIRGGTEVVHDLTAGALGDSTTLWMLRDAKGDGSLDFTPPKKWKHRVNEWAPVRKNLWSTLAKGESEAVITAADKHLSAVGRLMAEAKSLGGALTSLEQGLAGGRYSKEEYDRFKAEQAERHPIAWTAWQARTERDKAKAELRAHRNPANLSQEEVEAAKQEIEQEAAAPAEDPRILALEEGTRVMRRVQSDLAQAYLNRTAREMLKDGTDLQARAVAFNAGQQMAPLAVRPGAEAAGWYVAAQIYKGGVDSVELTQRTRRGAAGIYALPSLDPVLTQIRPSGRIARGKNGADRLSAATRANIEMVAKELAGAEVTQGDAWKHLRDLVNSLPFRREAKETKGEAGGQRGRHLVIIDPPYWAASANYDASLEFTLPALIDLARGTLAPAHAAGIKIRFTNDWSNTLAVELRRAGFQVIRVSRGSGDAELVAFNWDAKTGEWVDKATPDAPLPKDHAPSRKELLKQEAEEEKRQQAEEERPKYSVQEAVEAKRKLQKRLRDLSQAIADADRSGEPRARLEEARQAALIELAMLEADKPLTGARLGLTREGRDLRASLEDATAALKLAREDGDLKAVGDAKVRVARAAAALKAYESIQGPLVPDTSPVREQDGDEQEQVAMVSTAGYGEGGSVDKMKTALGRMFYGWRKHPELPAGHPFGVKFTEGWRLLQAAPAEIRLKVQERVSRILGDLADTEAIDPVKTRTMGEARNRIRQRELAKSKAEEALRNAIDGKTQQKAQAALEKANREAKEKDPADRELVTRLDRELEANPYHLFRKYLLWQDLQFRGLLPDRRGNLLRLPRGVTQTTARAERDRLAATINGHRDRDRIKEAVARHYAEMERETKELEQRGYIIPDDLRNPFYVPHKVLDYWSGRQPKAHFVQNKPFRGYLEELTGSVLDVETDYLQALYSHFYEVEMHNREQDFVSHAILPYDQTEAIRERVQGEEDAQAMAEKRDPRRISKEEAQRPYNLPPGHTVHVLDERLPLAMVDALDPVALAKVIGHELEPGKPLAKIIKEAGADIRLTAEMLKTLLVPGEARKVVIPVALAREISRMMKAQETAHKPHPVYNAVKGFQDKWKFAKLFSPHTVWRYTYGNVMTDALGKMAVANPRQWGYVGEAFTLLRRMGKGEMPQEVREAIRHGVMDTVTEQEAHMVTELLALPQFRAFATPGELKVAKAKELYAKLVVNHPKHWEQLARLSRFLQARAELSGKERDSQTYGGAYWREVEAIPESAPGAGDRIARQAAKVARDTFVDYTNIGVNGSWLRNAVIPFYSWMEGNFVYHKNLFKNALDAQTLGDPGPWGAWAGVTRASAVASLAVARLVLKLALPYALFALWNHTGDNEEDEMALSEADKRRLHLVLGRDSEGKVRVIYVPDATADILEWIGGPGIVGAVKDLWDGQPLANVLGDTIAEAGKSAVNKAVGSLTPLIKAPVEMATGQAFFPDVTDMRKIPRHDRWWTLVANLTDQDVVRGVRGFADADFYSTRSNWDAFSQWVLQVRRRDPQSWAFYSIRDKAEEWDEQRTGSSGSMSSAEGRHTQVLRNFRRAIFQGDMENAHRFHERLVELGYDATKMAASIRGQDPLATIPREFREEFQTTLTNVEKWQLHEAYKYYAKIAQFKGSEKALFPAKGEPKPGAFDKAVAKPEPDAEKMLKEALRSK